MVAGDIIYSENGASSTTIYLNTTTIEGVNGSVTGFEETTSSGGQKATRPPRIIPLLSVVLRYWKTATNLSIGWLSLITNGMSLVVFLRLHRKTQNVMAVFVAISVVDTFALIEQFHAAVNYLAPGRSILRFRAACRIFMWVELASQDCSAYLALLYTAERFISVLFPLRRAVICTQRRILAAMFIIFVLCFALESYVWFLYDVFGTTCSVASARRGLRVRLSLIIHTIIGRCIPYLSVAILNLLIVYQMLRYRKQRAEMSSNSNREADDKAQRSMTIMLLFCHCYYALALLLGVWHHIAYFDQSISENLVGKSNHAVELLWKFLLLRFVWETV